MKLSVRGIGGEILGAGNWKMLKESVHNVVVCGDDRWGHSKVTCSHAKCISSGMNVAKIILVEDRLVQIHCLL